MSGRIPYFNPNHPPDDQDHDDKIYSTAKWRRFRSRLLRQRPLCESPWCEGEGNTTLATVVHHVQEIREGGAVFSNSNCLCYCSSCHNRHHNAGKRGS